MTGIGLQSIAPAAGNRRRVRERESVATEQVVEVSIRRHGRLAIALGTGGKRVLAKSPGKTVKAIEARNFQAKAADLK
jgi:hypothetical protein